MIKDRKCTPPLSPTTQHNTSSERVRVRADAAQRNATRCDARDAGVVWLGVGILFEEDDTRSPIDFVVQCSQCQRNAIVKARACNAVFHHEGV